MALSIVSFFAVIIVIVLFHEIGHFVTAKAFKVGVDEFGIGYPPRLVSFKHGETRYSLNALPLGGFVKLVGEEDSKVEKSLAGKSIGVRVLVLSTGSLMNFLLPLLLFTVAFMVPNNVVSGQVVVEAVAPDSPAELAQIEPGDTILSVNGRLVRNLVDLQRYFHLNLGEPVTVQVKKASGIEEVRLTPRWRPPEGQGAVGTQVRTESVVIERRSYPVWQAVPMGINECIETYVLFKNEIISIIIGAASTVVTGPVGIAQMTGQVARAGFSPLLEFAGFLSINLAIINLLPLPALDGGRIAFVLLEGIRRGKRIAPRTEGLVHMIGFALLITLALLVTYQDILRIVSGEGLLP